MKINKYQPILDRAKNGLVCIQPRKAVSSHQSADPGWVSISISLPFWGIYSTKDLSQFVFKASHPNPLYLTL